MIRYFNEGVNISFLKRKREFNKFLKQKLKDRALLIGDINFIFCTDEYLLDINKQYLNHDYYTDTITFSYNNDNRVSGDIFISLDRVAENSKNYNTSFLEETYRVMIHGFLHLLGFEDKKTKSKNNLMLELQEALLKEFLAFDVSRETDDN